jgi:hypothetical protein
MDRTRMEPIASCYAVLISDAQFRGMVMSELRPRPALHVMDVANHVARMAARFGSVFAEMRRS